MEEISSIYITPAKITYYSIGNWLRANVGLTVLISHEFVLNLIKTYYSASFPTIKKLDGVDKAVWSEVVFVLPLNQQNIRLPFHRLIEGAA